MTKTRPRSRVRRMTTLWTTSGMSSLAWVTRSRRSRRTAGRSIPKTSGSMITLRLSWRQLKSELVVTLGDPESQSRRQHNAPDRSHTDALHDLWSGQHADQRRVAAAVRGPGPRHLLGRSGDHLRGLWPEDRGTAGRAIARAAAQQEQHHPQARGGESRLAGEDRRH